MRLTVLEPLRHRDFRLLFIGQTVSMVGNQLYLVALPFQIIALGGSALQLGAGFTIFAGAQLLTILFSGALVDRVSRRRVILTMDLLSACVVAIVAGLGLAHRLEIPHCTCSPLFWRHVFLLHTGDERHHARARPNRHPGPGQCAARHDGPNGQDRRPADRRNCRLERGPPWAFAIDAATFAFSFAIFYFSSPPTREKPAPKPLLAEIREGFAFTFSVTWIWVSIVGFAATNGFFFAGFTVALPSWF